MEFDTVIQDIEMAYPFVLPHGSKSVKRAEIQDMFLPAYYPLKRRQ